MTTRYLPTLLVLLSGTVMGTSALAQISIAPGVFAFTSESAYDAATYSIEDSITFNGLSGGQDSFINYGNPGSLTAGGVTFTTPTGTDLYVIGPNYAEPQYDFPGDGTSTLGAQYGASTVLTATLPVDAVPEPALTAAGTEIGTYKSSGSVTATVTLADGTMATYVYAAADANTSGLGFLGFVTTGNSAISSLSFSDATPTNQGSPALVLDNFTYGVVNPAAVPEPASIGLLGIGAVALLAWRRRLASR